MSQLPAGPRIAPLQTLRFAFDNNGLFRDCLRRYGDPFTVPTLLGTMVVTADPEGIREIFTADPDTFASFGAGPLEPFVGKSSMLLLSGARHRRERKLLMPPFHGERMRAYGRLMQSTTAAHAAGLRAGQEIAVQDLTQSITLDLILGAVFGVQEPERVARFRDAVTATLGAASPALVFFPALQRPVVPAWRRQRALQGAQDALIREQIERRRASGPGDDVLSLMLAARDEDGRPMSDEELRDELVTMIAAGHETTAISLAWAMAFVHRDRRVLDRLLAEIDALGPDPDPESVARLPYLGAVCDETLRLRPPASIAPRLARAPFRLRGHDIPPGTAVIASITMAHLDPARYPSPEAFRPERFLERKYSPFEFLPFGGGARRCLGAAFAAYEMKLVLATLLSKHRFSPVSTDLPRTVRRNLTFGPGGGAPMRHDGVRPPPRSRAQEAALA